MLKKILGYLFYVFSGLCLMSFLGSILQILQGNTGDTTTAKLEHFIALILAGFLAHIFFKYANRWTRRKPRSAKIE